MAIQDSAIIPICQNYLLYNFRCNAQLIKCGMCKAQAWAWPEW